MAGWHGSDSSGTKKPCNGACRTQVQYLHMPPFCLAFLAGEPAKSEKPRRQKPAWGLFTFTPKQPAQGSSRFQLPLAAPVLAFHLPQLQTSTSTTAVAPRLAAASTSELDALLARFAATVPAASDRLAHPPFAINNLQIRDARACIRLPPSNPPNSHRRLFAAPASRAARGRALPWSPTQLPDIVRAFLGK